MFGNFFFIQHEQNETAKATTDNRNKKLKFIKNTTKFLSGCINLH